MASAVASYVDAEAASAAVVAASLVDSRSANGPKWAAVRQLQLQAVEEQQDYSEDHEDQPDEDADHEAHL